LIAATIAVVILLTAMVYGQTLSDWVRGMASLITSR